MAEVISPVASLAAHIRCYLLDHGHVLSQQDRDRMMAAACILEKGRLPGRAFVVLDSPPMRVLQERYVKYVEAMEATHQAVAAKLGLDPSTLRRHRHTRRETTSARSPDRQVARVSLTRIQRASNSKSHNK